MSCKKFYDKNLNGGVTYMSYTEIYGFDKKGDAYYYNSVKNAWRGGMAIWQYLEKKYLPPYYSKYAHMKTSRCFSIVSQFRKDS